MHKIIPNMPATEYHAHHAVSASVLHKVARSPLHARAYLDGMRDQPTAAMQFGTALHAAVLEPELYANSYVVFDGDHRTKAGKEAYNLLTSSGASIVSRDDYDAINRMAMSIKYHPTAGVLVADIGKAEHSVFWTDQASGLECKCRPDLWLDQRGIIVDMKTTEDASPEAFARSVMNYRYHVQAAHYLAGTKAERFIFVAVEKKPPYAVAVYELDPASLELGLQTRDRDLATYAVCASNNYWPGYSEQIEPLTLPGWAFPQTESEEVELNYV